MSATEHHFDPQEREESKDGAVIAYYVMPRCTCGWHRPERRDNLRAGQRGAYDSAYTAWLIHVSFQRTAW